MPGLDPDILGSAGRARGRRDGGTTRPGQSYPYSSWSFALGFGSLAFSSAEMTSAATCILTILSGLVTLPLLLESPFLSLSTYSIPDTTWPKIVYFPSSAG